MPNLQYANDFPGDTRVSYVRISLKLSVSSSGLLRFKMHYPFEPQIFFVHFSVKLVDNWSNSTGIFLRYFATS